MEGMSLALKYRRYFFGLLPECIVVLYCIILMFNADQSLPECIVVVDGWYFISHDAGEHVKQTLKAFSDLFENPEENAGNECWYIRLLLTSPGNSSTLRELGPACMHDFNLRGQLNTGANFVQSCSAWLGHSH